MKNKTILKENMKRFGTKNLKEGYAWERKADGTLPTLKDATKQHESNISEQEAVGRSEPISVNIQPDQDNIAKADFLEVMTNHINQMEKDTDFSAGASAETLYNNCAHFINWGGRGDSDP